MTLTKQNIEQQETFISTYEKYLRKFSEDEKKARLKDIKESYVTLNVVAQETKIMTKKLHADLQKSLQGRSLLKRLEFYSRKSDGEK